MKIFSTLRELWIQYTKYQVIFPEYKARHICTSPTECFDWMNQYPESTQMIVLEPKLT